jgi:hypothetical protein
MLYSGKANDTPKLIKDTTTNPEPIFLKNCDKKKPPVSSFTKSRRFLAVSGQSKI